MGYHADAIRRDVREDKQSWAINDGSPGVASHWDRVREKVVKWMRNFGLALERDTFEELFETVKEELLKN